MVDVTKAIRTILLLSMDRNFTLEVKIMSFRLLSLWRLWFHWISQPILYYKAAQLELSPLLLGLISSWITYFQKTTRSDIGHSQTAPSMLTIRVWGMVNTITKIKCRLCMLLLMTPMLISLKPDVYKIMAICPTCASWLNTCSHSLELLYLLSSLDMMPSRFQTFFNLDAPNWVIALQSTYKTSIPTIRTNRTRSESLCRLSPTPQYGLLHVPSIAISTVTAQETVKSCRFPWDLVTPLK